MFGADATQTYFFIEYYDKIVLYNKLCVINSIYIYLCICKYIIIKRAHIFNTEIYF